MHKEQSDGETMDQINDVWKFCLEETNNDPGRIQTVRDVRCQLQVAKSWLRNLPLYLSPE